MQDEVPLFSKRHTNANKYWNSRAPTNFILAKITTAKTLVCFTFRNHKRETRIFYLLRRL